MNRTPRSPVPIVGASLAIVAAAIAPASAQIIGLPTPAGYNPYDNFAQRWYDPGDWYGVRGGFGAAGTPDPSDPRGLGVEGPPGSATLGAAGRLGGVADPGAFGPRLGVTEGPRMIGPSGRLDGAARPARPWGSSGASLFDRGDSPNSGWIDGDRTRDFYDMWPSRPIAASGPAAGAAAAATPSGPLGRGPVTRDAPRSSGFGEWDYVERGALPSPTFGVGPRYRSYYSDDWYSDSAAFDDWYDSSPAAVRSPARPGGGALDRPAPGTPGSLREPAATSGRGAGVGARPEAPGAPGPAVDLDRPDAAPGDPIEAPVRLDPTP